MGRKASRCGVQCFTNSRPVKGRFLFTINMNILNIITLLQMALSLLSNPSVQANPRLLSQANTFASQAIGMAKNEIAREVASIPAQSVPQNEISAPSASIVATPPTPPTTPTASAASANVWVSENKYMVSNQFALDPNANNPYAVHPKVMATSTFNFTISGRFIELKRNDSQQTPEKWFPVVGVPLTITYGDQSETSSTNSDGVSTMTFRAIGIPGDHNFTYSSPGYAISDYGTVTEWPIATSTSQ